MLNLSAFTNRDLLFDDLVALDLKRDQVDIDWYGDGLGQACPPLNERILMDMAGTGQEDFLKNAGSHKSRDR
jgi:hypothetical protein